MSERLVVDPVACDGYGYCAELAPEVVRLDEWGYPVVGGTLGGAERDAARRAVAQCPRRALTIVGSKRPPALSDPPLRGRR